MLRVALAFFHFIYVRAVRRVMTRMNPADEKFPGNEKIAPTPQENQLQNREVDGLRVGAVPSYSVPKSTTNEVIRDISRGDSVTSIYLCF